VEDGYINPFTLINKLTKLLKNNINIVPCSSGGTYTSAMQVMEQQGNNLILSSKGLGSMGYGLAGAIGVSLANQNLTILFEGDGGFAQNIQELGVVSAQELNIKIFVFNNDGYASIRSTQNRYFKGNLVGSSLKTGVQIPNLELIAKAFNIKFHRLSSIKEFEKIIGHELKISGPVIFEVVIDPELNYYPKIESKMGNNGQMISQPLHMMIPEIESSINIEINDFWENLNEQN
jgi:acetolactate synthase-1/2/3 large subunit